MDREYNYMLLDRLRQDCLYYLDNGDERHLWAGNVEDQINEMKNIWYSLNVKPEWLSISEIESLGRKMLDKKYREKKYIVGLYPFNGYSLDTFLVKATNDSEALDKAVAFAVNQGITNLFYEVEDIDEEEAEEMGLLYIDATMEGADRPVYIDGLHLEIHKQ